MTGNRVRVRHSVAGPSPGDERFSRALYPCASTVDESIVIVGVCGSGKSTLANGLRALGYRARACVQEHSYVPTLWLWRGRPRVLVCLEASLATVCRRRGVQWAPEALAVQRERLALARAQCDLLVDTDPLSIEQVRGRVVEHLIRCGLTPENPLRIT